MPRRAELDSESDSDAPVRPTPPPTDRSRRADRKASGIPSQSRPIPNISPSNASESDTDTTPRRPTPPPRAPRIPAKRRALQKASQPRATPVAAAAALPPTPPPLPLPSGPDLFPHFHSHPKRTKQAPVTRHPAKPPPGKGKSRKRP
ncbi:hypothetical protein P7C70_g6742, partial [Phenoliferia sp. Uapishka_3]